MYNKSYPSITRVFHNNTQTVAKSSSTLNSRTKRSPQLRILKKQHLQSLFSHMSSANKSLWTSCGNSPNTRADRTNHLYFAYHLLHLPPRLLNSIWMLHQTQSTLLTRTVKHCAKLNNSFEIQHRAHEFSKQFLRQIATLNWAHTHRKHTNGHYNDVYTAGKSRGPRFVSSRCFLLQRSDRRFHIHKTLVARCDANDLRPNSRIGDGHRGSRAVGDRNQLTALQLRLQRTHEELSLCLNIVWSRVVRCDSSLGIFDLWGGLLREGVIGAC